MLTLRRALFPGGYPKAIWLNPEPEQLWPCRQSISVIREIVESRMFPITIEGLERAMRYPSKQIHTFG